MERLYNLFKNFINQAVSLIHKYPAASLFIVAFYILYIFIIFKGDKKGGKHVRGAKIIMPSKFKKVISSKKRKAENKNIMVGAVELPIDAEDKQNFLFGRPGAGKSTIFNHIILKLIERNEKGIIYDEKFDYIPMFFDKTKDLILNVADARSIKWSIVNEIDDKADLISLAKSLIPDATGAEQHWNDTARGIFIAITREFILSGKYKNKELFKALSQKVEDIYEFLVEQNAPEAVHISNPRNASDVMSTLMRYISWLEYAEDGDFSIRKWLADTEKRFIFVANNPKIKDIQRPLLTLFIDLLAKNCLSFSESRTRRFYFLLDELGTLGKLTSVVDLLTQGRSKGIRTFVGIQDVGQFDKLYGRETRNTIINACSNYFLLAQNEAENAKFASDLVGANEAWQTSHSANDMGADSNSQDAQQIKPLILPSEFQSMDNWTAYIRILKNWQFTKIPDVNLPAKNEGFILNNSFKFDKNVNQ
jgi:type IV secretory pathway TraG/TraD family ATPase VirD4